MIKFYSHEEMKFLFKANMTQNEAVHQLILGNINYVEKKKAQGISFDDNVVFGVIFDGDKPVYYFNNLLPYNMVITPSDPKNIVKPSEFGRLLAEEFNENGIEISGIQCIKEFGESFVSTYSKKRLVETMGMDIMVANKIKEFPLQGEIIRGRKEHKEVICKFYQTFIKEALNDDVSDMEVSENVEIKVNAPNGYIWLYKVDGEFVGINMSTRQLEHGACINAVYVDKPYRNNGFCKQMVSHASKYYLEHGYEYVTLYVDKKNPYSNGAYLAVGYESICSVYCYEEE